MEEPQVLLAIPGFIVAVLVNLGIALLSALVRRGANDREPARLEDFDFPTVDEGRTWPALYGTRELKAPMVGWYGDLRAVGQPEGHYDYHLGMQLMYCSGEVDEIVAVRFDDRDATPDSVTVGADRTEFTFSQQNLFGGPQRGGGVAGAFYVYRGTPTQTADDYLMSRLGANIPGYANRCYGVMRGMYVGTSEYVRTVSLVARRTPNGLGLTGGAENIDGDANPGCVIYDMLTAPYGKNGAGIPGGAVDVDALRALAYTCQDEGLGISIIIDQSKPLKEWLHEICRHIDATMPYTEPSTGLLTMKLIRNDYDPETLPVLDESNCTVKKWSRASWEGLSNTVRVSFIDRASGYKKRTVQAQDPAAIAVRNGEVVAETVHFEGFSNATIAQKAAAQILRNVDFSLAVAEIEVNRHGYSLRPGDAFKLTSSRHGANGAVYRILNWGSGTLTEGMITLEVVEDVFGIDWTAYTFPPPPEWEDPLDEEPTLLDQGLINAPYALAGNDAGTARAIAMACRGDGVAFGYRTFVRLSTGVYPASYGDQRVLTPSGLLTEDLPKDDYGVFTEIHIADGPDTDPLVSLSDADFATGKGLILIDNELMVYQYVARVSGGFVLGGSVIRGMLDTVPEDHATGARVWFLGHGHQLLTINQPLSPPVTNHVKFQAYNPKTEQDFSSAPVETLVTNAPIRAALPLPPRDVAFNAVQFPATISGELAVSWQHRNRLTGWTYADGGVTPSPEINVTYTIEVYGDGGALKHTEPGITAAAWVYPEATEKAENGGAFNSHLRVLIWADRDGDESWQVFEWEFDRV